MTPDRRTFLTTAGLAAIAAGTGLGTAACAGPPTPAQAAGTTLAATDVPEGGGVILDDGPWVVTQPAAGQFRAFSKTCTHQGCPVAAIEGADIVCPCHGARYSIQDGSVRQGPASKPLRAATVTVDGGRLHITG